VLAWLLLLALALPLLSQQLALFDRAASLLPLPAFLVVQLALFVDARHREHAELAVVQQLTTVVIATPSLTSHRPVSGASSTLYQCPLLTADFYVNLG